MQAITSKNSNPQNQIQPSNSSLPNETPKSRHPVVPPNPTGNQSTRTVSESPPETPHPTPPQTLTYPAKPQPELLALKSQASKPQTKITKTQPILPQQPMDSSQAHTETLKSSTNVPKSSSQYQTQNREPTKTQASTSQAATSKFR